MCPTSGRSSSVGHDWCAWLPVAKSQVFDAYAQHLETLYSMMSVVLNEAIDFRKAGRITKANEAVCIVAELCLRLTRPLAELLRCLVDHAKHYGTIPNVQPLDPANFQGPKGQHSARMSGLLCLILLSQRAQFLHKTDTLQGMVEDLGFEFTQAAEDLADGLGLASDSLWRTVDADHFDLNTCLRESNLLLKSFLLVLPEDQLQIFQKDVGARLGRAMSLSSFQRRPFRHRRVSQFAAQ